jgi:predicted transcriptional regulator
LVVLIKSLKTSDIACPLGRVKIHRKEPAEYGAVGVGVGYNFAPASTTLAEEKEEESGFDRPTTPPYTCGMDVRFSADEIAQLAEIAAHEGVDAEKLVEDAALRLLQDDANFRAAVQRGIEQADRGEFIEEDEMNLRVERMLSS